jgi:UDP-2,3-diacylglucosamine pyrophosphatase LpxH
MSFIEHHRTIWLSDIHLGSRACRVGMLLDFLAHTRSDVLYLVGDIIDVESLRQSFYWPKTHTEVLQKIFRKGREGTRIVYIPGNHDDDFRALVGTRFGFIEVERQLVHKTADGRRLLVLHGDEFDSALKCGMLALVFGCFGYRLLLVLNRANHWINEMLGRPYWSLAQSVKIRIGKALRYVARFEAACLHAAREAKVDGVVCGHIHKADLIEKDGLVYCNDGDWVESCTALLEDASGELTLCRWAEVAAATQRRLPLAVSNAA